MTQATLRQLEIFVQVARSGSLSRAAGVMDMAPSLISRSIGLLEGSWGAALFRRTGRGIVLTDFGAQMLPQSVELLDRSIELEELAREAQGKPSGTVRLGIIPSLAATVSSTLIPDLQAKAPDIRLMIREGMSGHIDEWLAGGSIDLAVVNRFRLGRTDPEQTIGQFDTFVVCSPAIPLARQKAIRFRGLAELPLILPHFQSGLRSVLEHHARQQGVSLTVAIEAESLSVMKHVAMAGDAVAILPECSVADEVAAGKLAVVRIVEPGIPRRINLASAQTKLTSRALRFTLARLRELMPPLLRAMA